MAAAILSPFAAVNGLAGKTKTNIAHAATCDEQYGIDVGKCDSLSADEAVKFWVFPAMIFWALKIKVGNIPNAKNRVYKIITAACFPNYFCFVKNIKSRQNDQDYKFYSYSDAYSRPGQKRKEIMRELFCGADSISVKVREIFSCDYIKDRGKNYYKRKKRTQTAYFFHFFSGHNFEKDEN